MTRDDWRFIRMCLLIILFGLLLTTFAEERDKHRTEKAQAQCTAQHGVYLKTEQVCLLGPIKAVRLLFYGQGRIEVG